MADKTTVAKGLLREALVQLRACGAGDQECVCYLTGPLDRPGHVDQLVHPEHEAWPDYYEISQDWLNQSAVELAHSRRCIRVQVHTHGGRAFHSKTDDAFPIVPSAGLLSLVIPRFAAEPQTLRDAYLTELQGDGSWREMAVEHSLVEA